MKEVIRNPCTECRGAGKTVQRRAVRVPIPAGVEDGQTLRMPVDGNELWITVRVADSADFRRDGADVHSEVAVSFTQAVLGGRIRIPGIYEDILLKVRLSVDLTSGFPLRSQPRKHSERAYRFERRVLPEKGEAELCLCAPRASRRKHSGRISWNPL